MKTALFGAELARFVNERSLNRFEETDARVSLELADPELVAELATAFGWTYDIPERLAEHGLALRGDGRQLTVAGALYLLGDPADQLGKAFVEILRFPQAGSEYDRRLEVRGPLHRQLQRAVDEIMSELGTELVVLGVRRYELPRVPTVVIREAVANALAHRSYETAGTATRIELYPHVVRITSPGGLPEPVTVDNIRETQAARNYRVITVLRRFGLAEDAGRGVDVMVDSMLEEMLEPPIFEDSGASVIVELPIRSAVTPAERAWVREVETRGLIAPGDRLPLVHAARGERLTNGRVRELTGAHTDEARRALQRLRDAGFLVQHGTRGGAGYTLNESLAPPAGLRLTRHALKDVILQLATNDGPPLTNGRVRERTGLDRAEALRLLDELVSEGSLERLGTRRGTRYVRLPPH
jgi:ATP-dependent DNA helicase RecG